MPDNTNKRTGRSTVQNYIGAFGKQGARAGNQRRHRSRLRKPARARFKIEMLDFSYAPPPPPLVGLHDRTLAMPGTRLPKRSLEGYQMDKMVAMRIHLAGTSKRSGPSSFRG